MSEEIKLKGVDISEFNGNVDFEKLKDHVDFVILRASFGKKEDKMFRKNAKECIKYGIPFGAYYYSYALAPAYGLEEVSFFISTIKEFKDKITYPVIIDMEDSDGFKKKSGMPKDEVFVDIIKKSCDILRTAGFYPMVYANKDWFETKLKTLEKEERWLAWWNRKAPEEIDKIKYKMLQYASDGKVEGIEGNVDLNYSYVDFHKLITYLKNIEKLQFIQIRTGLEAISMQYLSCYKWGKELVEKIYKRLLDTSEIKNKEDEIDKIIQDEFKLEDKTMQYLKYYVYYEELKLKLYKALAPIKIIKEGE